MVIALIPSSVFLSPCRTFLQTADQEHGHAGNQWRHSWCEYLAFCSLFLLTLLLFLILCHVYIFHYIHFSVHSSRNSFLKHLFKLFHWSRGWKYDIMRTSPPYNNPLISSPNSCERNPTLNWKDDSTESLPHIKTAATHPESAVNISKTPSREVCWPLGRRALSVVSEIQKGKLLHFQQEKAQQRSHRWRWNLTGF